MTARDESTTVHPCGLVGAHVGACNDCGAVEELGWAHLCRNCWDRMEDDS